MGENKLSSMLVNLAIYLEENKVEDIGTLFKTINDELKKQEEEEVKRKLVELFNKSNGHKTYSFYVSKNERGLYDIWLVLDRNWIETTLYTPDIIEQFARAKADAYVVENVDKENAQKFIRALHIHDRMMTSTYNKQDCKDLVSSNKKESMHYWSGDRTGHSAWSDDNQVYNYTDLTDKSVYGLELDNYQYIETFKDAIDTVFSNKFVGLTLKLVQ